MLLLPSFMGPDSPVGHKARIGRPGEEQGRDDSTRGRSVETPWEWQSCSISSFSLRVSAERRRADAILCEEIRFPVAVCFYITLPVIDTTGNSPSVSFLTCSHKLQQKHNLNWVDFKLYNWKGASDSTRDMNSVQIEKLEIELLLLWPSVKTPNGGGHEDDCVCLCLTASPSIINNVVWKSPNHSFLSQTDLLVGGKYLSLSQMDIIADMQNENFYVTE